MLTNAAVKAARPRAAAYKLNDGRGLHLYVAASSTWLRSWRLRFRWGGKEQLLTIGSYPEVSLDQARADADVARARLARGEDPRAAAKVTASKPSTFEAAARAWHAHARAGWSPVHAGEVLASLERDVFAAIGADRLDDIAPPTILRLLRAVEARDRLVTARRIAERVSCVLAHARLEGWMAGANPAAEVAKGLAGRRSARHHAALESAAELRELLAAAELVDTAPGVKLASRLLALTAVRFDVVRGATWAEIEDLDGAEPLWRVPAARMKLKVEKKRDATNDHLVPLAPAAVEVLREARAAVVAGSGEPAGLIFVGRSGDRIGEKSIGALYQRAGFAGRHVPHGWRASFSTIMNRTGGHDSRVIERALGHATAGMTKVEAAYNRNTLLDQRRALLVAWAELLVNGDAGRDAGD